MAVTRCLLAAFAAGLLSVSQAQAQGATGIISGRVVDSTSLQPIASVQIQLDGTQRGTITRIDGGFVINEVAVGAQRIKVSRIGYRPQTVDVTVRAGTTSTGVQRLGDFKLQWGSATSDSDHEQLFILPEAFADMNFAVITTIAAANHSHGLSLSRPVNSRSFIVNRDGSIDGARPFCWLAIGR